MKDNKLSEKELNRISGGATEVDMTGSKVKGVKSYIDNSINNVENIVSEEELFFVSGGIQDLNMSNADVGGSQVIVDNSVNITTTITDTTTTKKTGGN